MVRIIRPTTQNPVDKCWYRILWSCNDRTYWVQAFWELPVWPYVNWWKWVLLCQFKEKKDAISMFCVLTNRGKIILPETVANGERKPYVGTVRTHRDCGTGKARLSLWD